MDKKRDERRETRDERRKTRDERSEKRGVEQLDMVGVPFTTTTMIQFIDIIVDTNDLRYTNYEFFELLFSFWLFGFQGPCSLRSELCSTILQPAGLLFMWLSP